MCQTNYREYKQRFSSGSQENEFIMTMERVSIRRKIVALMVAVVCALALAGCSSSKSAEEPQQVDKQTLTIQVTAPADAPDSTVLITVTQEGLTQYASYATVNGFGVSFDVAPGTWTVQVSEIPQTTAGINIYKEVVSFPVQVQSAISQVISLEYTDEYYASIHPEQTQTTEDDTANQSDASTTNNAYSYTSSTYVASSNTSNTSTTQTVTQPDTTNNSSADNSASQSTDNTSGNTGTQENQTNQSSTGGDTSGGTGTGTNENANQAS